jgi:hypothetical protein
MDGNALNGVLADAMLRQSNFLLVARNAWKECGKPPPMALRFSLQLPRSIAHTRIEDLECVCPGRRRSVPIRFVIVDLMPGR